MYIIKYVSCGLLLLLVISDLSSAEVRLCGPSLTQFLEMVCVDGFNQKNLKAKKSVPLTAYDDNGIENYIQPSALSSIFMDKLYANHNNLMAKTRRRRHDGVADECCLKSCTMPELLSYCR